VKGMAKKKIIQQSKWDPLFNIINYTIFTLFMLICLYPFYYVFIATISANNMVDSGKVMFFPIGVHFTNYIEVLKEERLGMAAWISTARTVLGTLLSLGGAAYMGYLFTKQNMWKRKVWYRLVIATMYFGAGLIPYVITMTTLHLNNNFLLYVLPGAVGAFNMIIVKTYIESLPIDVEESAVVDGAGYFTIFTRIIIPCAMPVMAAIAVFTAVGQWNSFMDNLLLVNNPNLDTLQLKLHYFLRRTQTISVQEIQNSIDLASRKISMPSSFTLKCTLAVVTILPILLVYPFMQKYFVKGIMMGAVKG